jgi:hypothetical protein
MIGMSGYYCLRPPRVDALNAKGAEEHTDRIRVEKCRVLPQGARCSARGVLQDHTLGRCVVEGTANSHGFFEGGTELATPFEGSTSRKIVVKIPGRAEVSDEGSEKPQGDMPAGTTSL